MDRLDQENPGRNPCRQLTLGMKKGEEAAWREFHRRYFDFLVRYAHGRGARQSDLEDLVQATYLRVLRHVRPMNDWSGFETWLRCLMRCEVIDLGRKGARRLALVEKYAHWQEQRRAGNEGVDSPGVEELLGSLSPEDRRLVERRYVEGWSHRELAAEARSTPKAIESKLARLRVRMREYSANTV